MARATWLAASVVALVAVLAIVVWQVGDRDAPVPVASSTSMSVNFVNAASALYLDSEADGRVFAINGHGSASQRWMAAGSLRNCHTWPVSGRRRLGQGMRRQRGTTVDGLGRRAGAASYDRIVLGLRGNRLGQACSLWSGAVVALADRRFLMTKCATTRIAKNGRPAIQAVSRPLMKAVETMTAKRKSAATPEV